jgi:hypothetical protein
MAAVIDITKLQNDITRIIGDSQNQYSVERDTEIQNALIFLTTRYCFYWNVTRTANLSHTNGLIALPANCARVMQLYDSTGNTRYMSGERSKFWVRYDGWRESDSSNRGSEVPFIRTLDKVTANESLQIVTGTATPTTTTFSMVHSEFYSDFPTWMTQRLYAYFLGKVSFELLNRTDNPDSQLLKVYDGMWREALKNEIDFGANAEFNMYNYHSVSGGFAIKSNSSGV